MTWQPVAKIIHGERTRLGAKRTAGLSQLRVLSASLRKRLGLYKRRITVVFERRSADLDFEIRGSGASGLGHARHSEIPDLWPVANNAVSSNPVANNIAPQPWTRYPGRAKNANTEIFALSRG